MSLNFGIARVVAIEQKGEDEAWFYVVEPPDKKLRIFVPIAQAENFRGIGSEDELRVATCELSKPSRKMPFSSKDLRLKHFQSESRTVELLKVAGLLRDMQTMNPLNAAEKKIFQRLFDLFSLEHSIIKNINIMDSNAEIHDILKIHDFEA